MAWHAQLDLRYRLHAQRCVAHHQHSGPLRILQSLYPEGQGICHNVLVHPPGGLVGGDTLALRIHAQAGTHGLITTPGASRLYRSDGPLATQDTHIRLDEGARLEWLPQETLCYSGCNALNRLHLTLAPSAQCLGWDVTALGLPLAGQPFSQGCVEQHLEMDGAWLERGRIDARDTRLLDGPTGLAGLRCLATLFFVQGSAWSRADSEQLHALAHTAIQTHPLARTAGVTRPNPRTLALRVLSPTVEPAMQLLRNVRSVWRAQAWQHHGPEPRIWAM